VLAIDSDQRAVDELRQVDPAIQARVVDCTDEEALREAGVLDVSTVVVAMSEPIEASVTATLIAKDSEGSRVRQVIARATNDLHMKMLQRVGADRVVFPSKMQGNRLGMELVRPNLLERLRLDDRNFIEEIRVPESFVGQSLRELNMRKNFDVSVLAAGPDNALKVNPPAIPGAAGGGAAGGDGHHDRPGQTARTLSPTSCAQSAAQPHPRPAEHLPHQEHQHQRHHHHQQQLAVVIPHSSVLVSTWSTR
jgi:trk system potassium uptake protein